MLSRRSVVGAVAAVAGIVVTAAWVDLWRILPITDPVDLHLENRADVSHEVTVRIFDGETEVFAETLHVEAGEPTNGLVDPGRETHPAVVERVDQYRVVGELDDGTTDEYALEPLDTPIWGTNMPDLVVAIDGELGRFRVIGAGGKP